MIPIHQIELQMIASAIRQHIPLQDVLFEANGKVYAFRDGKIFMDKTVLNWSNRTLYDSSEMPALDWKVPTRIMKGRVEKLSNGKWINTGSVDDYRIAAKMGENFMKEMKDKK